MDSEKPDEGRAISDERLQITWVVFNMCLLETVTRPVSSVGYGYGEDRIGPNDLAVSRNGHRNPNRSRGLIANR